MSAAHPESRRRQLHDAVIVFVTLSRRAARNRDVRAADTDTAGNNTTHDKRVTCSPWPRRRDYRAQWPDDHAPASTSRHDRRLSPTTSRQNYSEHNHSHVSQQYIPRRLNSDGNPDINPVNNLKSCAHCVSKMPTCYFLNNQSK